MKETLAEFLGTAWLVPEGCGWGLFFIKIYQGYY
jgi:glycerol uptake facilitator-like aquaporin